MVRRLAALTAVAWAALCAPALGHAVISPPVVEPATLQVFTLSVPTEREDRATTSIELTVPKGFAIDSFAPARGWRRKVSSTGSGEGAVVNKVTWTGGNVPTEEDAVFQFNASASAAQTYTFQVRQTYDDETVVDWAAPRARTRPRRGSRPATRSGAAAARPSRSSRSSPRASRCCSAPPRCSAPAEGGRSREAARASGRRDGGPRRARRARQRAGERMGARLAARHVAVASRIAPHGIGDVALTFSEVVEPRFAAISISDTKGRQLGTGAPVALGGEPAHDDPRR